MRLPYLQVTQETWLKARELAGLLDISRHHAMGLIVDLWAWALELGPPDKPPTGELTSPNALRRMAAAVEFPAGRMVDLADALQDVGLIEWSAEVGSESVRVRGMDRYHRTWKRNRGGKTSGTDASGVGNRRETDAPDVDVDKDKKETESISETAPDPKTLQAVWNECKAPEMPGWKGMSATRKAAARARLRDRPGLDEWRAVITRLAESRFARGLEPGHGGRTWIAGPDFLLKPDSADKVLEGKYDNRTPLRAVASNGDRPSEVIL